MVATWSSIPILFSNLSVNDNWAMKYWHEQIMKRNISLVAIIVLAYHVAIDII